MDRGEQTTTTSNSKSLSFSISSILNEESKDGTDSDTEEEESTIQIPIAQKASDYVASVATSEFLAGNTAAAMGLPGAEFSPWLYRPMALPGYLPLQTSFLTSKFAGKMENPIDYLRMHNEIKREKKSIWAGLYTVCLKG